MKQAIWFISLRFATRRPRRHVNRTNGPESGARVNIGAEQLSPDDGTRK
jgi:hypothetical protein